MVTNFLRPIGAFLVYIFSMVSLTACGGGGAEVTVSRLAAESEVTSLGGDRDDFVTMKVKLSVIADGGDVYIPVSPGNAFGYRLEDQNGAEVPSGTRAVTISPFGEVVGGYFRIKEGKVETVELTITYTPGVTNTSVRLQLLRLNYNDVLAAPTLVWNAEPLGDYRTALKTVVN